MRRNELDNGEVLRDHYCQQQKTHKAVRIDRRPDRIVELRSHSVITLLTLKLNVSNSNITNTIAQVDRWAAAGSWRLPVAFGVCVAAFPVSPLDPVSVSTRLLRALEQAQDKNQRKQPKTAAFFPSGSTQKPAERLNWQTVEDFQEAAFYCGIRLQYSSFFHYGLSRLIPSSNPLFKNFKQQNKIQ